MEFPFGHHHQHHQRPEDESNPNPSPYPNPNPDSYPPPADNPYGYEPPPPQPHYGGGRTEYDRPPPPVQHESHEYGRPGYEPPPPAVHHVSHEYGRPDYEPQPPPRVQHVSHEVGPGEGHGGGYGYGFENQERHHQRPGFVPSSDPHMEHVSHDNSPAEQRTVRIYTKAAENFSLSIREGKVVLVPANPRDEYQHWIKDMKYSTRVKDEEGLPSFALVNKATGQAIKHAVGATHPVRLIYPPDYLDESILWTESNDTGEGFRCIRMVNNIGLNFDAFNGDEDHGGVRDGTTIVLWEWLKGKNQRWKIVPY